jgi:hypothetical protein
MQIITDFLDWVVAVFKAWHGWLSGSAIAGAIGITQGLKLWQPRARVYVGLVVFGVCFSFFEAWRKERVLNRNGPDVFFNWESGHRDFMHFRNIGQTTALNVRVGEFSWPELKWRKPIELQALHCDGNNMTVESDIYKTRDDVHQLCSLGSFLGSARLRREPLLLDVSFSDSGGNRFTRTFRLRSNIVSGVYLNRQVMVEMGTLRMTRN